MMKFFYAPGACAFAPHFVLHELDLPHDAVRLSTADDAHRTREFLDINPLAEVPALVLDDGTVLTETAAILAYLAQLCPEHGLWPADPREAARCHQALAFLGSSVHGAFRLIARPDRLVPEEAAHGAMERAGRARVQRLLHHVDATLEGPWLLGELFSVADPYLLVMFLWARYHGVELPEARHLPAWFERISARPAFGKTLVAEGLVDAQGQFTPPARF